MNDHPGCNIHQWRKKKVSGHPLKFFLNPKLNLLNISQNVFFYLYFRRFGCIRGTNKNIYIFLTHWEIVVVLFGDWKLIISPFQSIS